MQGEIRILPLRGIGEVRPGDDLVAILATAIDAAGGLEAGDILVVTQKIVSKAEGRLIDPATVEPSPFACEIARTAKKDTHYQEVQNMLLAVFAFGLAAGWMCAPLFAPAAVRTALGLAEDLHPQALIPIGYLAQEPKRRPRRPLNELVVQWL